MRNVIVHVTNEDPFVADLQEIPTPGDTNVTFYNPRMRDGKPLRYVTHGMSSIIFPWHRISFIEVMSSEEERREVVEFFRER
jgi:hypothetical protein